MRVLCTDNKMAIEIQYRNGTTAQHSTFVGALGEVTVDTTKDVTVVHDGVTAGGFPNAARANTDGTISLIKKDGTSAGEVNSAGLFNNTLTSTNTNQALTAAQGKALNDKLFGVNQTTVDVTSSRFINTTYTNTTGRPIFVLVNMNDIQANTQLVLDGVFSGDIDYTTVLHQQIGFMVRDGGTYKFDAPTAFTIIKWLETR